MRDDNRLLAAVLFIVVVGIFAAFIDMCAGCAATADTRAFSPAQDQEQTGTIDGSGNTLSQTQEQTTWNTDRYMLTLFMGAWAIDRVLKYVALIRANGKKGGC